MASNVASRSFELTRTLRRMTKPPQYFLRRCRQCQVQQQNRSFVNIISPYSISSTTSTPPYSSFLSTSPSSVQCHIPSRTYAQMTDRPYFQRQRRRLFSNSSRRAATVVRHNPKLDEDGKEMHIIISERAAKRLKQIVNAPAKRNTLTNSNNSSNLSSSSTATKDSHLRVSVTSGGCHGFQYLMSLESADKVDPNEDTIFEFDEDAEVGSDVAKGGKAQVVMDEASLELLKDSTIDFTTELIGSQFKIVGNPRATSSCGCGTSFDIE